MFGKVCQSCSMPMSKDKNGGGTERDGSLSTQYCSHCYQRGTFVEPRLTAYEMIEKVKLKLISMGIPSFLTGFFTRGIVKLDRWRR